jgi:thioredoxin-like negative regulator of GroEL
MALSRKSKYLILFFLFLLLLLCFLATAWILITRSYREVEYYRQAVRKYQLGENNKAKELMRAVIRDDWNNELAIATLAEWYDNDKEWNYSAWLWLRAANLNAFKVEYLQNARQAFFRCRSFQDAFSLFEQKKPPLDEHETLQYAYCALSIGRNERAKELFDSVTNQAARETPLGKLLQICLPQDAEKSKEETFAELTALLESGDHFIVFECLVNLHYLELTHFKRPEEAVKRLEQAADIDPLCGIPALGDYYFIAQKYDQAAETYQKNPENGFWNLALISRYAEALTMTKQAEKLIKLAERCQTGDKELLLCGFYLDALHALINDDHEKVIFFFAKTEGRFQSPMAQLLNLLLQIEGKKHFEIENLARFFASDPSLLSYRIRSEQILFPHLLQLLQDDQLANAASLARIMQRERPPEILLVRIDIADKAQQGTLDLADMNRALRNFPDDEFLLRKFIEVNLKIGNWTKAMQEIEALRQKLPEDAELGMFAIVALSSLQKFDQADAVFSQLLESLPESTNLLSNFLNYCLNHKRLAILQRQIIRLEAASRPEIRDYLPVLQALADFLQGERARIEELLSDLHGDNPELLYHAAYMLANLDRLQAAIRLYKRIPKEHPKYNLSQLNLSESLAAAGDQAGALETAKKVWESTSNWPAARECYGLRLLEIGKPEAAVEVLDPLMVDRNATERTRENWRKAMHQNLAKQFEGKQFDQAQKTARRILLYWKNDSLAASYAARIRDALSEQEKAEREAAQANQ